MGLIAEMAERGGDKVLLGLVAFGAAGLFAELLLLGHFEQPAQWIPLGVLVFLLLAAGWEAGAPSRGSRRALWAGGWSATLAGGAGIALHLRGNALFEQEMNGALHGWSLVKAALLGGVPALAPGALAHLGLLTLFAAWRVAARAATHSPAGAA